MKKYLILLLAVFALNSCQYEDEIYDIVRDHKTKKVEVCHYDADTDTWITLSISKKALPAHLKHGDGLGECAVLIEICHYDSNTKTWETISINENELATHLEHGDYKGQCNRFVDPRDGNEYSYVQIGDQIWMTENLRATKLNNGKTIPLITDNSHWTELATPGYCWYNNELENKNLYGALYNYYTIETGELAPEGWHIPTADEWLILTNYLGGMSEAGGKMKETGTMNWQEPNTGATNESSFTAIPGGFRSQGSGVFYGSKKRAEWWEIGGSNFPNETSLNFLEYDNSGIGKGYPQPNDAAKKRGVYVRCIKD